MTVTNNALPDADENLEPPVVEETPPPPRKAPPKKKRTKIDASFFSVQEAATYLGIGTDAVYAACARRHLKHVRWGSRCIRLRREWLDAWVEHYIVK